MDRNFLMNPYLRCMTSVIQHIYILPLLISAILSLKAFRLRNYTPYKLFAVLLWLIFIVEVFAFVWKRYLHNHWGNHYTVDNLWVYNIFLVPQYLLYAVFFYRQIESAVFKKIIISTGIVFPVIAVLNIFFVQSIYIINSINLVTADSLILLFTAMYLEQLFKQEPALRLSNNPMAWICLGAILYHLANIPYVLLLNYLWQNNPSLATSFFYTYMSINFIMYTLYSIAFLCQHPQQK
jgi:hypothetical protein